MMGGVNEMSGVKELIEEEVNYRVMFNQMERDCIISEISILLIRFIFSLMEHGEGILIVIWAIGYDGNWNGINCGNFSKWRNYIDNIG